MEKNTLYNSNTKGIVWMTYALPLVPLNRIDEALNLIRIEIEEMISPSFASWCENYIKYISNTWINGNFSPETWNFFERIVVNS